MKALSELLLSTNGLTKQYGHHKAVDKVNLHIKKGAIYGFIGRNGAGKTTCLKMISGLARPTAGEIEMFGCKGKELERIRSRVGCLIEAPGLYGNMNAYTNLKIKCELFGIRKKGYIEDILETVGLEGVGKKKTKHFSLGMKQRLGIGLALVGEPDLLVLDEPINGLDPQGIAEVRDTIQRLRDERNMTILISSHILEELSKIATDYGIIHNGSLLQELTSEELMKRCSERIEIELIHPEQAVPILDRMGFTNYQVTDKSHIHIFERLNESANVNMELAKAGILVNGISITSEELETISGLSAEEAKERLVESLKEEAKTQAQSFINDIMDDAKLTASKEAKRIVIQSIQRVATETAIENSVTVFHIESDEIKGRIIGREGRNIRALEAATGVEIVVDDTPEAIVLSAFDPVRREIARLALHQLVTDGRIHPARIEEVVAKVRKQVEEEIIETGKRTTIDLGIHGLHPELIRIIGKMKYRSSYGQNLLQHARETANLCAVMASELGLNPKKAKRAGLLHDIGKVPDEEPELPHALLGMKLAEKYKEKPDICNAIGAHHDETEMTSLLAPIVQVCDAISGARPGARREIVEAYIKRLNDLEQLAMSYPGVTKTYAIQAGRELRVIVGADKIDDKQTESLSGEIAKKIQDEMTYPGQVKITVIRETRAVSFAK